MTQNFNKRIVDPAFRSMRSHSMVKTRFFILFGENLIF